MNSLDFEEITKKFIDYQNELITLKGKDYATEDVLSNFKQVAEITQLPIEKVILVLISVKVARLGNLFKQDKPPLNESVVDSLVDLSNYVKFLNAAIHENDIEQKNNLEQIKVKI